jgi:hypothetical protein
MNFRKTRIPRIPIFTTVLAMVVTGGAFGQAWQKVAHDHAGTPGEEPHLLAGKDYTYPETELSGTVPDRTVAFGDTVAFGYENLSSTAGYRVQLVLLSGNKTREEQVWVNGVLAIEDVELPPGVEVRKTIDVPEGATSLEVDVLRVAGDNAVVSEIDVESTAPGELKAPVAAEKVKRWIDGRPSYVARPAEYFSLDGEWSFCADGPEGMDWKPIEVPGEWVMEGFSVKPGQAAGYCRTFAVPAAWVGRRIMLRFDGVYSEAVVKLNGKEIGRHLGGFTPFEFDVTDALQPGENTLTLGVTNESLADKMASGSSYAEHPLGGIPRKVTLFAVPAVHLAGLEVTATPDETLTTGTAHVEFQIVNAGKGAAHNVSVHATLEPSDAEASASVEVIDTGAAAKVALDIPVDKPDLWDTEHPHLYNLTLTVSSGETVQQEIGFKRIEVRGNQLFVNNQPVKLHGACRHETHPTRGRSLTPALWQRDAELYQEANLNLIRTSHYPPPEEFIAACDKLGIFVECEMPLCWSGPDEGCILNSTLETVETYRNHPSVLYWSLANESRQFPAYEISAQVVKALDPSRPRTFNWMPEDFCEINTVHYPGPQGPDKYRDAPSPVNYGEYSHLNVYNRYELAADPGLRDAWGRGFRKMWDAMFASQGTLGGSLWAAMDDTFVLPDGRTVGYGDWGLLDNWRRPKPEYWQVKKTYSPVRIYEVRHELPLHVPIELPVLNQSNFANLNEYDIRWSIGNGGGKIAADVPPHGKGALSITPERKLTARDVLKIEVTDPRGFVADRYAFNFVDGKAAPTPSPAPAAAMAIGKTGQDVLLIVGKNRFTVSRATGLIIAPFGAPTLMVLPLNSKGATQMGGEYFYKPDNATATDWKMSSLDVHPSGVTVAGEYAEASGTFTYTATSDGGLDIGYRFAMKKDVNPRQVGLVFDAPRSFDTIAWQRKAPFTVYPDDDIGRASGSAHAFGAKDTYQPVNLRTPPTGPWSQDATEGGTRDFRSTREDILWYQLGDGADHAIKVLSDGSQHARAWVDGDMVRLLVADYSNAGGAIFFRSHASLEDRPLKAGSIVEGTVRLEVR